MRRSLLSYTAVILGFGALFSSNSHAQVSATGTPSYATVTVTTSATNVIGVPTANTIRYRIRVQNTDYITASGGAGIVVWCRWGTVAAAPATVRGTSSFPVFPGGGFDDVAPGVNQSGLNCIAESGTPIVSAISYEG